MSRTVPETPNNAFTPSAISVATSTGFNQGDLVYQSNTGNFGRIPDNAISSDTFNVNQNSPIMATPINGGVVLAANTTGSSYGHYAATLSNGNIVHVYNLQSNQYFKITDVNNTVVVAQTLISSTFTSNFCSISVAALSGGGFVAAWVNTSGGTTGKINYAVYTNTGTVTLAATQDTTFTGTYNVRSYMVQPLALPNGGFVLMAGNNVLAGYYRIYNASGTALYPTTLLSLAGNNVISDYPPALAARSDSSFIVACANTGSTAAYTVISATNTVLVAGTTFTSTVAPTNINYCSAACLSDGTTFVIGYAGINASSQNQSAFRFLPASNTLSSETFVTNGISSSSSYLMTSVTVEALASGNFLFLCSEYAGLINYAVFNSSGVCISGTSSGAAIPKRIWAGQARTGGCLNTVIVTSASINIYWTYSHPANGIFGLVQSYVRLDLNTYDPIPVIGATRTITTTTAGVSGYNIATATPTNAKFNAASTSLVTSTQSMGFVRNETIISSGCNGLHSATLNNGNFVVVYASNVSPFPITAAIYTFAGTLVTSFIVSSTSANTNSNVRVATLSNGNFAVVYATGSTTPFTLTASVYTDSGTFVGTSTVTTSCQLDNSSYGFYVSGITNNRFVIVWSNDVSNNISFRVFDSSCVALTAAAATGYAGQKPTVGGYPAGGFAISFFASPTQTLAKLNETSTNVFSAASQYNFNSNATSNAVSFAKLAISSTNMATMLTTTSNNLWNNVITSEVSSDFVNSPYSVRFIQTSVTGAFNFTSCFTAYGNIVTVHTESLPAFYAFPVYNNVNTSNLTTGFALSASSYGNSASIQDMNLIPLYGNVVLFTYKDGSSIPKFVIFNATPYTQTQQITAGVTASNGVQLSQQMGYSLAGVAATTATAGSVGQVQTNGIATLNNSYNASTPIQSFDFQNNTGVGVKGTITGRSVTLQGNV